MVVQAFPDKDIDKSELNNGGTSHLLCLDRWDSPEYEEHIVANYLVTRVPDPYQSPSIFLGVQA